MNTDRKHFSNLAFQEKHFKNLVEKKFDVDSCEKIFSALAFSKRAHEKQFRDEGAPYVIHPIRTAYSLLDLNICSVDILCAALLHDVVEDTGIPIQEIKRRFGKRTSVLVENVTRARPLHETESEKKKAKIQKFKAYLIADYETRLIKCADMLDNIRSWSVIPLSHPSRKKFARWYAEAEHYSIPIAEKTDATLALYMRDAFAAAKTCADA